MALLAGLGTAEAQIGAGQARSGPPAAPSGSGAGSFPQSFLIPGTNTSLSLYGKVQLSIHDNIGSQHTSDQTPQPAQGAPGLGSLLLEGPGASGGTTFSNVARSFHGGLRAQAQSTNFAFETRTPTDLGEVKTVLLVDFSSLASQSNYIGSSYAQTAINPKTGAGNNSIPRIQWAYGTLGPWLFGQYNSAWADPILFAPDIGDQNQVGPLQTVNIRRPQIRYTYLAGSGITLSGSLESMNTGSTYCTATATSTCIGATGLAAGALATTGSDNTDVTSGSLINLPSFNTGVAWDQPWGHLMARVGVGRSEIRNATANPILGGTRFSNNITQWHWAVEGGVMVNTWGQDQWRGLVNYSHGLATYNSDAPSGVVDMVINGQTGQISSLNELELTTNYIHRFNPNWRMSGAFGVGFFNKPSAAAGFGNCATATGGAVNACVSGGASAAQLASLEKRHIFSGLSLTYSPVPGMVDIKTELDYYDRKVQASNTGSNAWAQSVSVAFYW
ncbi:MAG TPA: porin [Stellaceae bacterium]|nr:porin [Stellaceae bacterium]